MEEFLNKEQQEDEMVRIRAQSYDLISRGFQHGNLEMPNNVVLLSEVFNRMDEFSKEVTEHWGLDGSMNSYDVYARKDGFHLLSYMDGKIYEDHRKDERPKSPEKVCFELMDGGQNPPKRLAGKEKVVYAEWAEREMEAYLADFIEKIDEHRKVSAWKNLSPENLFFDVHEWGGGPYRYSYKNGKTFVRPR